MSQTGEEEPPEESATLSVCKIGTVFAGREFVFTVTGNSPSPEEFSVLAGTIVPNCVDVSIGPGEFTVTENSLSPTFVFITGDCEQDPNNRLRATGEIQAGDTQECTFLNETD